MNERLVEDVLAKAHQLGAADAETILARAVALEIEVAKGEVETLARAESVGMGIRLFAADRRVGFAYTTDLSSGAASVVEAAWQNCLGAHPDEHNVLPEEAEVSEQDWVEQDFSQIPISEKVDLAREMESKTLAADKRITHVQQASYSDCLLEMALANSHGLRRSCKTAHCLCSVVAAGCETEGDSEMGWEFDFSRRFDGLRGDWVAHRCAQDVLQRLGGKLCDSGLMTLVLDNYVAAQFLEVLGPALMASQVLKGKSLFAGQLGQAIASDCVTLVDQSDYELGMNRAPFDGEGAGARRTVVVDKGVGSTYLHNAYTAHKMGVETTANAGRGGNFRTLPEVSATNFYLSPGAYTQEELFKQAGGGLFVRDAMGVHMADPVSGDFSFGVAGRAIERGQLGRAVRGVTVAGNVKDVLCRIRAVGNDLRFFGAYGAPSILVEALAVSGA
jgi:PmbA protein